mgnify:CR=1 FL=1
MNNSSENITTDPTSMSTEGVSVLIIAFLVLILLSMIFSCSESAFLSINKLRVRFLRTKKNKGAIKVSKLLERKELLLNTILVGNNIVNIAITSLLTSLALQFFGQAGVGLATIFATVLLLIFGEITPKTIGSRYSEPVAFLLSGIISFFMMIFSPLVYIFTLISRGTARLFRIKLEKNQVSFTEEEIKNFIDVGEEEGVLEKNEKNMMHRVFKFTDLAAKDVMTPRTKIVAIPSTVNYNEILELSMKTKLSRFPVYRKDIDDIIGILYVKDMLFYGVHPSDFSVKEIMRPPLFVVGTKKMSSVQQMMRENKQSLAVVIDEYSGTDGILSTEDIAAEIFGSISDEYSLAQRPLTIQINEKETEVDASIRLSELSEKMGILLQSEFYDTLAGFITEKLDKIPQVGDYVLENGYKFTVIDGDETHIKRINIYKETSF